MKQTLGQTYVELANKYDKIETINEKQRQYIKFLENELIKSNNKNGIYQKAIKEVCYFLERGDYNTHTLDNILKQALAGGNSHLAGKEGE